jgi:integrase
MKGQIEKRGNGAYRLRWYDGRKEGRRVYNSETIHGTKKQAERRRREILARQDRGHAVPSPSRIPTLREYVKGWKAAGSGSAGVRPRTFEDYLENLDRYVLPKIGDLRLDAIHTARIELEVVKPLREAGKLRTAGLVKAALSKVMRAAVKDPTLGLVGNPCHGVEVGGGTKRRVSPMDAAERAAFREAIRGKRHEALFLLLMGTGLRPSEARALGWEHVDLGAGVARVERSVDDSGRFHAPKTEKARRAVPLPPEVRQALRELHLRAGRPESGLVFPGRRGKPLDPSNLLRRHFRPALERAKVGADETPLAAARVKELRLYDLRHGFATAALESGADVRTTADLMGHATTKMTMEVYQHVSDERKREAAERIGSRLFGAAISAAGTQAAPKGPTPNRNS